MTVTREIPHGTPSGYNHYGCRCAKCKAAYRAYRPPGPVPHGTRYGYNAHGCRCDDCRRAKNDYAREHGSNRRVGKRAEQKRQADLNLRHPCKSCGALCARQARLCDACQRAAVRAGREKVERLWAAGVSAREIGRMMGWTTSDPGTRISELRARGYDLPPRRVLSAEHRAKLEENLTRARAARGKTLA